jgi:hypothetical protein
MVGTGPGGLLDVTARLLTTAMKDYASPFRLVKSEFDRWGPIVEASGFRPEN